MNFRKSFAAALLVASMGASAIAQAAPVTNLRTSVSQARVRVVLDSVDPIVYKDSKNGLNLVIDLPESTATRQKAALKASDTVSAVNVVPKGKKASQLQITLKKDAQYKVYRLPNPNRLVVDIFSIAIIKKEQKLAEGVTYTFSQDEFNGRQVQTFVVSVAPDAKYELVPFSAAGTYNGRGSLTKQANLRNMPAAINASYFDTDGWVIGNVKHNGNMMAMDAQPRTGYARMSADANMRMTRMRADSDKQYIIKDIGYTGTLTLANGQSLNIKGMNRARIAQDLVLFNSYYAPSTKTNEFGREIKIKNGRVTANSTKGNMSIEPGTYVISGHGANADALAKVKVGDKVTLTETLGNQIADAAETVVSGGPLLLENGKVNVRTSAEKIAGDISWGRSPRTAVGLKKDGTLLLVVVDGRSTQSGGFTLAELAQYMLRLGAVDAVNFDGGGSSEMVVNGKAVNRPSDGKERLVSIGLGLVPK